jgi:hypothetical protein
MGGAGRGGRRYTQMQQNDAGAEGFDQGGGEMHQHMTQEQMQMTQEQMQMTQEQMHMMQQMQMQRQAVMQQARRE